MEECVDCYKIKCRGCGWEPTPEQLVLVQKGIIAVCPLCGWFPRKKQEARSRL